MYFHDEASDQEHSVRLSDSVRLTADNCTTTGTGGKEMWAEMGLLVPKAAKRLDEVP